jgi:protocatechuate 3,4-dioxygenase beta subunit
MLDPPADTSVTLEKVEGNGGGRLIGEIDSAGYFSFLGLEPALWRVAIESGDSKLFEDVVPLFAPLVLPPVHPDEGGTPPPSRPREARMEEVTLSRRVLGIEREHVAPIEGAWIWSEGREADAVRSSSDGTYRLQVPQAPRVRISIAAPEYLPVTVAVSTDHEDVVQRGPLITLHPAVQLTGCVRDIEGQPLPDARVEINIDPDEHDRPRTGIAPVIGFTNSVGCFYQQAKAARRYQITGMAPGFVPQQVTVDLTTEKRRVEVDFLLPAPQIVSGHVADQSGVPIEGAEVTLVQGDRQSARLSALAGRFSTTDRHPSTTTSAKGAFEVRDVSPGTYSIVVIAAGFEPAVVSGAELEQSSLPWALGTIFLAPAAVFEGRVEDPSGNPVAGADVWVSLVSTDGRSRAARPAPPDRTDAQGYFVIEDLGRDQLVEVRVEKDGFVPMALTATPTRAGDDVRIVLEPASSIQGKVLDERLTPVPNVAVKILTINGKPQTLRSIGARGATEELRTGEDGTFRLSPVEAGVYELSFKVSCCPEETRRVEVPAEYALEDLEVILRDGVALGGVVTDSQGASIADAVVTAAGRAVTSGKDGRFRLSGLPEEPIEIKVRHRELGVIKSYADTRLTREVTIVFRDPGVIAGRVIDHNGGALSGARVFVDDGIGATPFHSTDSGGYFRLKGQPGTYQLRAAMEGYSGSVETTVLLRSSETADVVLTLDRGAQVSGRILGALSIKLGQANVRAVSSNGRTVTGTADYEGRYRVLGLEPGPWRVIVDLPNGERGEASIKVREGQRDAFLDLDVTEGYSLKGRILLDRQPLANGWVTVTSPNGVPIAHAIASLDGRFDVTGLVGEPIHIRVTTPEGDMHFARTVNPRHDTQVEIEIQTGRLSGSIRCADTGVAVTDAVMYLIALDQTRRDVQVGRDGSFGPLRLAQGNYRLEVVSPQYLAAVIDTQITAGRESQVTVLLSPLSR